MLTYEEQVEFYCETEGLSFTVEGHVFEVAGELHFRDSEGGDDVRCPNDKAYLSILSHDVSMESLR